MALGALPALRAPIRGSGLGATSLIGSAKAGQAMTWGSLLFAKEMRWSHESVLGLHICVTYCMHVCFDRLHVFDLSPHVNGGHV